MTKKEFNGVEELWFWFCAIMITEQSGVRPKIGNTEEPRVCDKNAIYRIIKNLKDKGELTNKHLRVITGWGQQFASPLYDRRAKYSEKAIWTDAMQKIEKECVEKGYINAI